MGDPNLSAAEESLPPASPSPAPLPGPEEPVAEPEGQLAQALAEAGRLREEWLRAKAESENVRRRAQDEVAKAHRFGVESMAAALLAVRDSLEAALAVENPTVESVREGVSLTARQLDGVLERFAIRPIAPAGERFDPHFHQALTQVESDQEPNTVVDVLQKGYLIHDRVLRPALVTVAKARTPAP